MEFWKTLSFQTVFLKILKEEVLRKEQKNASF